MARTVDELAIKISVEGTAQINDAVNSTNNLDSATKRTGETLKGSQNNIRNVAFQVQDMAVQIAGGTSAFVAMGQQLPQLLGGFGAMGAVIGAVAAIGIPLLRVGLQAAGVDMRDLHQMTTDLTDSTKAYQAAQTANLPTLVGLGNTYGALTSSAKDFFDIQEQLTRQKANFELSAALKQLRLDLGAFTDKEEDTFKKHDQYMGQFAGAGPALRYIGDLFRNWSLGLTGDQAKYVADQLKQIDEKKPEAAATILNNVLTYLKESGIESGKLKKLFDSTIEPILKINNQLLETKKILNENAQAASDLNATMLEGQAQNIIDVGRARRNFDQVKAIALDGQEKIAEFTIQANEKSSKDGVSRAQEIAAFRIKTEAEVLDKQKDFYKTQSETYKASHLSYELKVRQLALESNILDIQNRGRDDFAFNVKYNEDIARISSDYLTTLNTISEQRRKNLIDGAQQKLLEEDALKIQKESLSNARQGRDISVQRFIEQQAAENSKKDIEEQIARQGMLGDAIRKVNQERIGVNQALPASRLVGLSTIEKELANIQEKGRIAAQEAARAFAEKFGDINSMADAQALVDGLDQIARSYGQLTAAQIEFARNNDITSRSWATGWEDSFAAYRESAFNAAEEAKTYFNDFSRAFEDTIVTLVQGGKVNFRDFANSIIADFARIQARKMLVNAANGYTEAGGASGIIQTIGSFFGFAAGGAVQAGVPITVGERGPEMFIPTSAGTIVPNNAMSTGNTSPGSQTIVNYNIQAVDASSFRSLVARDPSFIYAVTEQGRRSQPSRRLG